MLLEIFNMRKDISMKKFSLISVNRGEEFESDSLKEIYYEMIRLRKDDNEHNVHDRYYVELNEKIDENSYQATEGKVYKRNNKYFFKAI